MDSIGNNLDSRVNLAQYQNQEKLKQWAPVHNLSLLDSTHWHHGTTLVVVADNDLRREVTSLFTTTKPLDMLELPKPSNLFRPTTGGLA